MKPGITRSAGVPRRGEITEVVGRLSSGRTSLVRTWLADVTARGGATALVDADDTFDPSSGARAGIDLRRLLWVRCAASGLAGAASGLAGAASGLAGAASGLAGAASGLA